MSTGVERVRPRAQACNLRSTGCGTSRYKLPGGAVLDYLTESEGTLLRGVPVTQVVPSNKHAGLGITTASGNCDALETTADIVAKVFPGPDELGLLCHVREVSLADTELAGSDDDGYLAVVLGNRVPRTGLSYNAFLISVEHRLDALPTSTGAATTDLGPLQATSDGTTVRFLVLATWSFRCTTGGEFQTLMTNLDVGSLGTVSEGDCPGVAPTGHVVVAHRTRRGEQVAAWYRGPGTPREVVRRSAGPPYFNADQARAIATDGIEDLSEAAAFELGRLLAMSDAHFLAALMEWRRQTMAADMVSENVKRVPGVTDLGLDEYSVGRKFGLTVLGNLSSARDPLGPRIPITDNIGEYLTSTDIQDIATGLGLDPSVVKQALGGFEPSIDIEPSEPADRLESNFDTLRDQPQLLQPLRDALNRRVNEIAQSAGIDVDADTFDPAHKPSTITEVYTITDVSGGGS